MEILDEKLYERLNKGPVVLFLGQNTLRLQGGKDILLSQTLSRLGREYEYSSNYSSLFASANQELERTLSWMHDISERLSIPTWLSIVSDYAWSGVFSSSIDAIWYKALRVKWREVKPIYANSYNPSNQRSKSDLHCTFLFGCVNQEEEDSRPPLNRREYLRRKTEAILLANRIPSTVTPLGTLLIEAYSGANDWFTPDLLAPILDDPQIGQAHIFSVGEEVTADPDIEDLVNRGKLFLHTNSLATFLERGFELGYISTGLLGQGQDGYPIKIGANTCVLSTSLWNQVSKGAIILDDHIIIDPKPISKDRRYQEFRTFLLESGAKPVWSGYARGFAFRRDFEKKLFNQVQRELHSNSLLEEPIILHGSSGTGKTIALGSLAFDVRRQGLFPVLFIERKSQRPDFVDIDIFCKWAEDNGASSTLVIWDGMLDSNQYSELLQFLTSRGRKAVVVGSSYRVVKNGLDSDIDNNDVIDKPNLIEVLPELVGREKEDFALHLESIEPGLGDSLKRLFDNYFLVALYRLLPGTRANIRSSLASEVVHIEKAITHLAKTNKVMPGGSLGYALWKAGLVDVPELLDDSVAVGTEYYSTPQEIVNLVMIPGKFGLKIPLELLMRALKKDWLENLEHLLRVDLFKINQDDHGNISVAPRHPLEARLITVIRFRMASQEVFIAEQLINVLRDDSGTENLEVQFVVDLVRHMGPNGNDTRYYLPSFLQLSQTLERLRLNRSIEIPRLMLQEATLIRESVVKTGHQNALLERALEMLSNAENILRRALELVPNNRRNAKLRSVILVELGATLGARNKSILFHNDNSSDVYSIFEHAKQQLIKAKSFAPNDYHAIDVIGWMSDDLLRSNKLSDVQRIEIIADITHLFLQSNPDDFDVVQQEHYYQRKYKLGVTIGDNNISDDAFASLIENGSTAGYYLRATQITGEIPRSRALNKEEREKCKKAAEYLQLHFDSISNDNRCLHFLLRSWWCATVGKSLFFGERQSVPLGSAEWTYLLKLVEQLLSTDLGADDPAIKYLQGLALFHLGSTESSLVAFREVERNSEYVKGRRRVIRSYLASEASGSPRIYHGSVQWVNEERNRGQISVEQLRNKISFLPRDFHRELRKGDTIGEGFHIAFNFIGPVADPVSQYNPSRLED